MFFFFFFYFVQLFSFAHSTHLCTLATSPRCTANRYFFSSSERDFAECRSLAIRFMVGGPSTVIDFHYRGPSTGDPTTARAPMMSSDDHMSVVFGCSSVRRGFSSFRRGCSCVRRLTTGDRYVRTERFTRATTAVFWRVRINIDYGLDVKTFRISRRLR